VILSNTTPIITDTGRSTETKKLIMGKQMDAINTQTMTTTADTTPPKTIPITEGVQYTAVTTAVTTAAVTTATVRLIWLAEPTNIKEKEKDTMRATVMISSNPLIHLNPTLSLLIMDLLPRLSRHLIMDLLPTASLHLQITDHLPTASPHLPITDLLPTPSLHLPTASPHLPITDLLLTASPHLLITDLLPTPSLHLPTASPHLPITDLLPTPSLPIPTASPHLLITDLLPTPSLPTMLHRVITVPHLTEAHHKHRINQPQKHPKPTERKDKRMPDGKAEEISANKSAHSCTAKYTRDDVFPEKRLLGFLANFF